MWTHTVEYDLQEVLKFCKDGIAHLVTFCYNTFSAHFIHYEVFVFRMHYSHPHFVCLHLYSPYFMSFAVVFFFSTQFLAGVCLTVPPPPPQLYCEFFLFLDDKDPWHSPWALFNNPSQTIKRMSLSEVKTCVEPKFYYCLPLFLPLKKYSIYLIIESPPSL